MTMRYVLLFTALLGILVPSSGQISFQGAVDQLVNHRDIKGADLSVSVIDVRGNQLLGAHREKDLLIPASSLKVLTTASALLGFGTNYRFRTYLKYSGYIDVEGVLHGDVYIVGGGDPCLASDGISAAMDLEPLLEFFQRAVRKAGIKRITGNIIGDARFLQGEPTPADWHKSDVGNYYGAGAWGLNVHENLFYLPFQQT
ncbi:MAG: D-alanyl-D-alanine carboxypeptidase, partial [Bacteroidota bacterium]